MKFKYGPFEHDENDVDIISVQMERFSSPRNHVWFDRRTMEVQGRFCSTGQEAIRTRIRWLENAYKIDHVGNVGLYHDDNTASAHVLNDNASINGVRVLKYEFPKEGGGEYATYRSYKLHFQADYLNMEDTIYSFEERLVFIGNGGPAWELIPTFATLPISYVHSWYTPQQIIQLGSAVGVVGWPLVPGPLYPAMFEHQNKRMVIPQSPQMIGKNQKLLYPISWRYEFETAFPVTSGYPRLDYPGH
jgi:hypothetical protein